MPADSEVLERLDEGIRSTANVNLMEAAEVQDLLLDLRYLLTREGTDGQQ